MNAQDYSTTLLVDRPAKDVFTAVNNVRGWWNGDMTGSSQKLNDEFEVRFGDVHYSKQKLTEVENNKKVVWLVTDSSLNFLKDKSEWTGTKISFEISPKGKQTSLRFTHAGLLPTNECFDACSSAWTEYLQDSLLSLITTGKGQPHHNKS